MMSSVSGEERESLVTFGIVEKKDVPETYQYIHVFCLFMGKMAHICSDVNSFKIWCQYPALHERNHWVCFFFCFFLIAVLNRCLHHQYKNQESKVFLCRKDIQTVPYGFVSLHQ